MDSLKIALLISILAPLVGSAFWFWLGRRKNGELIVTVGAVGALVASFLSIFYLFLNVTGAARIDVAEWIPVTPQYSVHFSFLLDGLSLALAMVVTGVGSLIHLYATSYMKGDPGFGRFFSYLNLFVFSMLMLTLSDSLPALFLGWEGVGLCSYLLISFWFTVEENASAGKKAFIVNRIGDFGFLIAMFSIYRAFGTLDIPHLLELIRAGGLSPDQLWWANLACFGLVLGATGKSAQIPLYIWLPDAMAGPTPVSALIHAATMVTAGIYLTCRLQPLFLLHPEVLEILAYIGGLTAFFAATIAIFQNDIKKVLAYSTISQLGYMFLAVGLMAPAAGFFHLITHAFFKALLFLGAGSVIYGLHHEQDLRHMGGLRTKMPITFWCMTIGVLAISGIPPLSGFASKDEILHTAFESGRMPLFILGVVTAFMTAFYMGRLWVMAFFGKFRGHHEAHESPIKMTSVLVVLAIASAIAGWLNWPEAWGGSAHLSHYLETAVKEREGGGELSTSIILAAVSSALGILGLFLAYIRYKNFEHEEFESPAWNLFKNKYYIDELYDSLVVNNLKRLGLFLWKFVDGRILDGFLNGLATDTNKISQRFRKLQTGFAQQYAFWVWLGVLVLLFGAWTVK